MKSANNDQKNLYFYLSTFAKGLKIIELLADEGELSVSEVAKRLGINRTSSHRYLATLKEAGYASQDENSRYKLSYKVFELGTKVLELHSIREEAWPLMQKLASQYNETVNFACLEGKEVIHLEKVESTEILRMDSPLGSRAPAYCTALGKAILAFLPQNEIDIYLDTISLEALTPNTITDRNVLQTELQQVRIERVAVDTEELAIGLRCVASPIMDRHGYPRFAISVSGASARMSEEHIEKIKSGVRAVCDELSLKLGNR